MIPNLTTEYYWAGDRMYGTHYYRGVPYLQFTMKNQRDCSHYKVMGRWHVKSINFGPPY